MSSNLTSGTIFGSKLGTAWGQWQPQLRIPAESVAGVCAFYSMDPDSPMELLAAASNASLQMDYTEEMAFRREAVEALNALADQLSGEARDDVLVLAEAVSDAPSTHIARYGWTPAFDVFHEKYAEGCGVSEV